MENRNLNFSAFFEGYKEPVPPGVRLPKIEIDNKYYSNLGLDVSVDNFTFLKELAFSELRKKNLLVEKYIARLNMELEVFKDLEFVDYVLLNWDILNFCHEQKIPTGSGRGSAAGSLVLFLIGVTKVDPIKYGLFFERFVSKSRAKKIIKNDVIYLDGSLLPDVDNDISYDRRSEVINYIERKNLGKTCKILTLNTLSGKLCVKECGKIVGNLSEVDVNLISEYIPKKFGVVADLSDAYDQDDRFRNWANANPLIYSIAQKLEGLIKNTGVHPSGIAISYDNINELCPLWRTSDGNLISGYDMNYVSEFAVKFDVLGLRTLTVADTACKHLGISLDDIDPEDPFIYECFKNLRTPQGLFQIEAETNFKVCKKVAPKNLEQLSAVVAIARPGALNFVDQYSLYSSSGEAQLVHNFFKEELSYTGGIPLYQEQLMKMVVKLGFSLDEAEQLRRIVGKKKVSEMPAWKEKINQKVIAGNLDPQIGEILWKVAEDSANYSFNKCAFHEEEVITLDGKRMLKDIKIGDRIKARDIKNNKDHFVKVLDIMKNDVEVINLWLEDGNQVAASKDHKFLTNFGMKSVKEILLKGYHLYASDGKGGIKLSKVINNLSLGVKPTIDLEVDHEDHNFYLEDIISSNSHSISYSILAAKTTYLKFKYPKEFFLALLKLSKFEPDSHAEINKISSELNQFNIKLLPPDLAKSYFDFSIEGENIRFGLNSIKGVSEKSLEALKNFRESSNPTKFDIFISAKQAGINIGLLSSLIQAGTLSSYSDKRSRLVLEAQTFNLLTDKEKQNAISLAEKYNYDILTIISENAFKSKTIMSNGKPFMSEKRCETLKKKYKEYKKIYDQNKAHERFANWVFEYKLLGYTPSTRLKTIFEQPEIYFTDCLEFQSVLKNERVKIVGVIQEVKKGKSSKTNKPYYRFTLKDEVGNTSALFLDAGKSNKLSEYLEDGLKIPDEEDIVVLSGRKGDDILWIDDISILTDKIYMKLSDIE